MGLCAGLRGRGQRQGALGIRRQEHIRRAPRTQASLSPRGASTPIRKVRISNRSINELINVGYLTLTFQFIIKAHRKGSIMSTAIINN